MSPFDHTKVGKEFECFSSNAFKVDLSICGGPQYVLISIFGGGESDSVPEHSVSGTDQFIQTFQNKRQWSAIKLGCRVSYCIVILQMSGDQGTQMVYLKIKPSK